MIKKIICLILLIGLFVVNIPITTNSAYILGVGIINLSDTIGDIGRFYIPAVNVNVRVYETAEVGSYAQQVVDKKDSAAWCLSFYGGCGYIADHWNQGFINIKDCQEGDYAYVLTANSVIAYECVKVTTGYNKSKYLITKDGENLKNIDWADFCCYTCDGNWQNIIMVFFKEKVYPIGGK